MVLHPNWRPGSSIEMLKRRAALQATVRQFFSERGVLEVSTPVLSPAGTTDPNIASLQASLSVLPQSPPWYLHTSPELAMKRLLAAGSGAIYQICPVFRDCDLGRHHRPEFTMLEWYRPGMSYHQLIDEVEQLVLLVSASASPQVDCRRLSYREAFIKYLDLDPFSASPEDCGECCKQHGLALPEDMGSHLDPWLDLMIACLIVPCFPDNMLTFIYDYPASQAALANIRSDQTFAVAERFELYWGTLELANGFQELTDPDEQRQRFENENAKRTALGLPVVTIDQNFLQALEAGLPESAGVALGVERLLMAMTGAANIVEVVSFADEV